MGERKSNWVNKCNGGFVSMNVRLLVRLSSSVALALDHNLSSRPLVILRFGLCISTSHRLFISPALSTISFNEAQTLFQRNSTFPHNQ